MSLQGVRQLKGLRVTFCKHQVSSHGVRALIQSEALKMFARENADVGIEFVPRNGREPTVIAEYGKY